MSILQFRNAIQHNEPHLDRLLTRDFQDGKNQRPFSFLEVNDAEIQGDEIFHEGLASAGRALGLRAAAQFDSPSKSSMQTKVPDSKHSDSKAGPSEVNPTNTVPSSARIGSNDMTGLGEVVIFRSGPRNGGILDNELLKIPGLFMPAFSG